MKTLILITLIASSSLAENQFMHNGKLISKLDATRILIQNPNAVVDKSCRVTLTEKLSLKCVKNEAKK
jgi:hypothetical protein